VNAFVSGLLGDEMVRKVRQLGGEVENEKWSYLGQYLELWKIWSYRIIRTHAICSKMHSEQCQGTSC